MNSSNVKQRFLLCWKNSEKLATSSPDQNYPLEIFLALVYYSSPFVLGNFEIIPILNYLNLTNPRSPDPRSLSP